MSSDDNLIRLNKTFSDALGLPKDQVYDALRFGLDWDSVGHMALVAALEAEFGVMLDTADVIDMSSFTKTKEILGNYGVHFDTL